MEYISGGELFDHVQKEKGMNEICAQEMFRKIVHGLQHCHSNGITHRDLKLENILLDEHQQPKVAQLFSRISLCILHHDLEFYNSIFLARYIWSSIMIEIWL